MAVPPGRHPPDLLSAASIALAVGLLGALASLLYVTREADEERVARGLTREARQIAADVTIHLSSEREMISALAQPLAGDGLTEAAFRARAQELMRRQPHILRLAWFGPDGRQLWLVPPAPSSPPTSEELQALARARTAGQAYSPPFELPEGPGFVSAEAVRAGSDVRGFLLAGYSAAGLLAHASAAADELPGQAVALSGPSGAILAGSVASATQQWALRLDPPGNGLSVLVSRRASLGEPALVVLAVLAALLGLALALNLRSLRAQLRARGEAEAALRESERRFREIADTAPVLIWISGTDAQCTFFNRPWLEFRGRRLDQELGDGWAEGVHADDLERCVQHYRTSFDARQPFAMEYRLRRHDGEARWVLDNGVPRFAPDGTFLGYIGSCIDITERRLADQALRESEDRYRGFLANFEGIAYQAEADRPAPTFVHGRVLPLTGHAPEDLTSGAVSWRTLIVPADRPMRDATVRRLRDQPGLGAHVEYRIRRRDGRLRWVEEHLRLVTPAEGEALLQGVIHDVTGRKEGELRERNRGAILELLARGEPLEAILDRIARSVEAEHPGALCSIRLLDPAQRRLKQGAAPSLPDFYLRALDQVEVGTGVTSSWVDAAGAERVVVEDLASHPDWAAQREVSRRAGLRALWWKPLRSPAGEVLGTFALYRRRPGVPAAQEIEAVEDVARFAAIAIERSRADEALRESEASLAALVERLEESNRMLGGVARTQAHFIAGEPPPQVFDELLATLVELTGSQHGLLAKVLADEGGRPYLRVVAVSDASCGGDSERVRARVRAQGLEFHDLDSLLGAAVTSGAPVMANDVAHDPRATGTPPGHLRFESFLGLPLRHGQEMVGMVALANRPGGYDAALLQRVEPCVATGATLLFSLRASRLRDTAERRLRESEQRYRSLVQGVDAIVWEADPANTRTLFISPQAEAILGYPPSRWLEEPGFWSAHIHPEDRQAAEAHYAAAGANRSRHLDYRMLAADGRVVWLHDISQVETDEQGRPVRLTGVAIDVTRARELEQAVTAAANEWVATFDAVDFAVLVLDDDQRVMRLNRAATALIGASWGECLGRSVGSLGVAEPWVTAAQVAGSVGSDGRTEARQVRDAAGRSWNVDATRASGRQGGPDRVIVTLRDVSDLVELTESVRRSQTMAAMGTLVAGVAHEVRNPLFAISVNIDALALELRDKSELAELVAALRVERDRLSRLMEELLHFGRPAPALLSPGPLAPVLTRSLQACRALADQMGVVLESRVGAEGLRCEIDAVRLEEVFSNLLENACQQSRPGQRVLVELRAEPAPQGGRVTVAVRDFGPGFAADVLPRAFEPFVTRRKGGTGLGLAIVQRIVDEHHGTVTAANVPGGGAVVTVELPLLAPEPAPAG